MPRDTQGRSSPRLSSSGPLASNGGNRKMTRATSKTSVIVLSSDDEESSTSAKKRRLKLAAKKKKAPQPELVLEISDDDEEENHIPPAVKREMDKLKNDNEKYKKESKTARDQLAKFSKEINELKASRQAQSCSNLDPSQLEDSVSCEICTALMWTPFILQCGHMFCCGCLRDWFDTTKANHMRANPNWNPNQPAIAPHLQHMYPNLHQPGPQYTCPTCREKVTNRPIEVFGLKEVVRAVASAMGQSSPKKDTSGTSKQDKRKAPSHRVDPWAGFFNT